MPLVAVLLAIVAALIVLARVSFRPSAPIVATSGRVGILVPVGLGLAVALSSSSVGFWEVTEAESEITDQYVVGVDGGGVVTYALLGALLAAGAICGAMVSRRSFAGLAIAVAWLLVGAMWIGFFIDDSSSRSSAELLTGPARLQTGLGLITAAGILRWLLARRAVPARPQPGTGGAPPPPPPPPPT